MYGVKILGGRKSTVRDSSPKGFVRQRIGDQVDALTRAGQMAARVELANEALCRLTQLVYEKDADGVLANVDPSTGRLLIPAPFGSSGWSHWGLRHWEGRTLNKVLRIRLEKWRQGQRPPLYTYDGDGRYWVLNLHDYETLQAALWWLKKEPVTLKEWREVYRAMNRTG